MADGWTYHACIEIDGKLVCIDNWPTEARQLAMAGGLEKAMEAIYPGATFESEVDKSIDLRQYVRPEDIVEFPWMQDEKWKGRRRRAHAKRAD